MRISQDFHPTQILPTLFFARKRGKQNPLVHIINTFEEPVYEQDFLSNVSRAAHKANCRFLFEVPGLLFGFPHCHAAAIQHEGEEFGGNIFILWDPACGTIQVLSGDEVPEEVSSFVRSYATVLACLQHVSIAHH